MHKPYVYMTVLLFKNRYWHINNYRVKFFYILIQTSQICFSIHILFTHIFHSITGITYFIQSSRSRNLYLNFYFIECNLIWLTILFYFTSHYVWNYIFIHDTFPTISRILKKIVSLQIHITLSTKIYMCVCMWCCKQ